MLSVRPSVCSSAKPLNSLKSSSFIIHPSSFIILHFATFKLFSLFNRCFTYFSLYWQYSDKSWHYVKDTPRMGVYFCKIIWQVAGAASVSVGDNLVVDNLVDCWFLPNFHCLQSPNIHWLQSPSVSLFKRWLKNALLGQIDMQQECKRMLGSTGCPKKIGFKIFENFSCLSKTFQRLKIGSQLIEYILGWPSKGSEG